MAKTRTPQGLPTWRIYYGTAVVLVCGFALAWYIVAPGRMLTTAAAGRDAVMAALDEALAVIFPDVPPKEKHNHVMPEGDTVSTAWKDTVVGITPDPDPE